MRGKSKSRKQNVYNMKGCSKSKSKTRTKTAKNKHIFLGGSSDLSLAYPTKQEVGRFDFLNPQTGGCAGMCPLIMKGGNGSSLPYPNGLLGNAWTPSISGWHGIDGISMGRNHIGYNTYDNDVSRQMRDVGANPPYTYLKGGKRRNTHNKRTKNNRNKTNKRRRKTQKGGLLGQELINIGRHMQYGIGSAYNGIRGYTAPVNPSPWKDQLQ